MTEIIENREERPVRPGFLTVLCVLSFITIGLGLILTLYSFVSGPINEDDMQAQRVAMAKSKTEMRKAGLTTWVPMIDQAQAAVEETNERHYLANFVGLITYVVGFIGVLFMFRGRKTGFHLYIIYSLIAMAGIYVYVSPENISMMSLIISALFSGLFIFLYSRNLHWMS